MRTSVRSRMLRLLGITTTALALTLGAGTADATPKGDDPDRVGHSKQVRNTGGHPAPDTNSPQPQSKADFSGHGANKHGPYDSTRDGSPSENGNGDGKATGKPCAGCVGKADNKNPRGQLPGGSDANSGYECDRNKGAGKGNPAHTACKASGPPGVAPPGKPPEAKPPANEQPEQGPPAKRGPAPQALATTGVDVAPPLTIGLAMLGAGGVLLAAGRRGSLAPRRRERYSHLDALYALTTPREQNQAPTRAPERA